jgi:hypothetical protein
MLSTEFSVYMIPGHAREVSVSIRPDAKAHAYCCTYADEAPILAVSHAGIGLTVTPPDRCRVDDLQLRFARDLAEAAATYVAALERLRAEQSDLAESDTAA